MTTYHLLPWVRQGLATTIAVQDVPGTAVPNHVRLPVTLHVNDTDTVTKPVRLYGPGDVTGLDPRVIIRLDPPPGTPNFEPDFFPLVEFDPPDLPWLMTPARATGDGRLRPWLVLITVRQQDGVTLTHDAGRPLPVLEISRPAVPGRELPDLAESWAWAHAQVSGAVETGESLDSVLSGRPERNLSRLIAPHGGMLMPNARYFACLVPAFEAGRRVGLGQPPGEDGALQPAWTSGAAAPEQVLLPVYYFWEFATSAAGDFETLVQLLRPRRMPPEVGLRRMDVSRADPRITFPGPPGPVIVGLEGALRSPDTVPIELDAAHRPPFESALRAILNQPEALMRQPQPGNRDPVVAPPIYGRWHAAQETVPPDGAPPRWLTELNLDPRYRAVAGFGTLVVQDQQEQLMASAWEQVGRMRDANQTLRQAQFARTSSQVIHEKRLAPLQPDVLALVVSPAQTRIAPSPVTASPVTFFARVQESVLPEATLTAAFRRVIRPRGPILRRMLPESQLQFRPIVQRMAMREPGLDPVLPPTAPMGMVTFERVTQSLLAFPGGVAALVRPPLRLVELTPQAIRAAPPRPLFTLAKKFKPGKRVLPVPGPDNPEAANLRAAAAQAQTILLSALQILPPPPKPILQLAQLRPTLLQQLDPRVTVPAAVLPRIQIQPGAWPLLERLEPIMAAPEFPQPMYGALAKISQDLVLPGLELIEPNTISLLLTNERFIESYMVGLNHEMSRELLWREYPTDQRGTYFRQFWDVSGLVPPPPDPEAVRDIPPIHRWDPGRALGQHVLRRVPENRSRLVLLIRSELLRRFPRAVILTAQAETQEVTRARVPSPRVERYPILRGTLEPDIDFFGFDLTVEEAIGDPGWFFVIQQQPTAPRFGQQGDFAACGGLANSAQFACLHLKQPIRVAIHADAMLQRIMRMEGTAVGLANPGGPAAAGGGQGADRRRSAPGASAGPAGDPLSEP